MNKTPEYNIRASKTYNAKFDRLTVNTPKGTKERIQAITDEPLSVYVNRLIEEDLQRVERLAKFRP